MSERVLCEAYPACGGCSVLELPEADYRTHKRQIAQRAVAALTYGSVLPEIDVTYIGAASRRRVTLKVEVRKKLVRLGYYRRKTHELVPISSCPMMEPRLSACLPALQRMISGCKKPGVFSSAHMTLLDNGVDMTLEAKQSLSPRDVQYLSDVVSDHGDIVRLSVASEAQPGTCYQREAAALEMAGVKLSPPPGTFLQPSRQGQQCLTDHVTHHLAPCGRITDLYSGLGTFTLPLLMQGKYVSAYEGNQEAVAALHNAVRSVDNLDKRAAIHCRDLYTTPLATNTLRVVDGVVINPPRNGAQPQVRMIADAQVSRVVMVYCNPVTWSRDVNILLSAGYIIDAIHAVDQFAYTHHLEMVACLTAPALQM